MITEGGTSAPTFMRMRRLKTAPAPVSESVVVADWCTSRLGGFPEFAQGKPVPGAPKATGAAYAAALVDAGRVTRQLPDADRYTRREFLLTADIEGQWRALTAEQRALFQAYADGVNRGATEVLANPATTPTLFAALGDVWEPWKNEDTLVVSMVFTEVTSGLPKAQRMGSPFGPSSLITLAPRAAAMVTPYGMA